MCSRSSQRKSARRGKNGTRTAKRGDQGRGEANSSRRPRPKPLTFARSRAMRRTLRRCVSLHQHPPSSPRALRSARQDWRGRNGHRLSGRSKDGRSVALKVIKDEFSLQPEFTNMFLDEAKIVSRLSHPNIVHVEELGHEGKAALPGHGAARRPVALARVERLPRARRSLALRDGRWIGARVAAGLHHAHELEIEGIAQGLVAP